MSEKYSLFQLGIVFLVGVALTLSVLSYTNSTRGYHKGMMSGGSCPMMKDMMGKDGMNGKMNHESMHEMMQKMLGDHFEEKHHEELHKWMESKGMETKMDMGEG